ncbi:glycoside hydrolase family 15 protein [Devosia aquimaris]|uniref:glycoside hydrolase family 15 protein n=1 Tax=Devosia aquimaris TaxID=2866214 RepID=UPI001CD0BA12|nr:glycoside hydrolase family 15 protein [Devosia sp. CJK-A8-3]
MTEQQPIKNTPPGAPGIAPTWSSSDKDAVTTSLGSSRIWATVGHGIVNEVYWPSTGHPQIRDLGFIVAGPDGWTEIKRANRYAISTPHDGVPLPKVVHEGPGYRLELEFLCHPLRDTLLIRYALSGDGVRLYALLAPHLGGSGSNDAFASEELSALGANVALCLRADSGFSRSSAGYVGSSDGWQDFHANGAMTWSYPEARDGNVSLMGELAANSGTLSLGFAETAEGARTLSRSGLADDYDETVDLFVEQWRQWTAGLRIPYTTPQLQRAAELSAAVIKVHEDRTYAGAVVASLSVPWGSSHDDAGGYHLVWTRDTVEAAFALVTIGKLEDAGRTLDYLIGTQAEDGSWAQNYFPDGRGYWTGKQLDEVALPVLLAAKLQAAGHLTFSAPEQNMVRKAIGFIVRNGPMSDQDRWEENAGASPFTLSVVISALVVAADYFAEAERDYLLALADCWNERIEDWTYAAQGPLAADAGIAGYYVRMSPRPAEGGLAGAIDRRNVAHGRVAAKALLGMEFLYLVRTGLRSPHDQRIVDTVKLVDSVLRRETPSGPSYYRYNGDGYGEKDDGSAFDGIGVGRLWPLLTGERGHYAVAAGEDAQPYLDAMVRMAGPGGLLPEQIWDSAAIPERGLEPGKPSGSAMPLVWAHGELLKLLAASVTGRCAESFAQVETRYGGQSPQADCWIWRESSAFAGVPKGRDVRVECEEPFVLHFGDADWKQVSERDSMPVGFGMHGVTVEADVLVRLGTLRFTVFFTERQAWREQDFAISLRG